MQEMALENEHECRVLIYSHDSYGLGHLRRSRTIAEALVNKLPNSTILIISGSEIAGSFSDVPGIDVIKIPGVLKQADGSYASRAEGVDLAKTLSMRQALISGTAQAFAPDIFIVDKEPMGLLGEVEPTLIELQMSGCKTVLGLRDVMDSPDILKDEWKRKDLISKSATLFDEIWIYGPQTFWNPLKGLDVPAHMDAKMHYVGFINRHKPSRSESLPIDLPERFILATAGGGGDGDDIMMQVLSAREHHDDLPPLILLTGPFMPPEKRATIHSRAYGLEGVLIVDFVAEPEVLMRRADAVIGMCGYNTFCEILSYDKPALYLPRTKPRLEQWVRATRAAELGLATLINEESANEPNHMAKAIRDLTDQQTPSESGWSIDLAGLDAIAQRAKSLLDPVS